MKEKLKEVMNDVLYFRGSIEDGVNRLWSICQKHIPKRQMPSRNDLEDLLEGVQNGVLVEEAVAELIALVESNNGIATEKCA